MSISQLSTRCIYIPPLRAERVYSVEERRVIHEQITKTFEKIGRQGVTTVLGLGGVDLDYAQFPVPSGFSKRILTKY